MNKVYLESVKLPIRLSFEDVRRAYLPALRHRILLNFEAQAENITTDAVLTDILAEVKEKAPESAIKAAS